MENKIGCFAILCAAILLLGCIAPGGWRNFQEGNSAGGNAQPGNDCKTEQPIKDIDCTSSAVTEYVDDSGCTHTCNPVRICKTAQPIEDIDCIGESTQFESVDWNNCLHTCKPGRGADLPFVNITYTALNAETYRLASAPGDAACAPSASGDWSYQGAKLIEIRADAEIFGGPEDALTGPLRHDTVLFDPIGLTRNGENLNGTYHQSQNMSSWKPRLFWKVPGRECYNWINDYQDLTGEGIISTDVTVTHFSFGKRWPAENFIRITEYAGAHRYGGIDIPYLANGTGYPALRFKESDSSPPAFHYSGAEGDQSYEAPLMTQTGSLVSSINMTEVRMRLALERIAPKPAFILSNTTATALFNALIDETAGDDRDTTPEGGWPALLSSPDTAGEITSPLRGAMPGSAQAKNLARIGGTEFAPFESYALSDWNMDYTGTQAFWRGSAPYSALAYSEKFGGNDYGIPICAYPGDLNSSTPDDWTSCDGNSNARTKTHRVKIKFMGSRWVISDMVAPTTPLLSSTAAINGGQIKLAKEASYGILNMGQELDAGEFKVRPTDISVATGVENKHPAFIDMLDMNDAVVGQIQVDPGTTYKFTQNGTGKSVMVHVYKTAPGFSINGQWAEVAVYSEEIVLHDGFTYNLAPWSSPDANFRVSLLWKNRNYTGSVNGTSGQADSLREIVVYAQNG